MFVELHRGSRCQRAGLACGGQCQAAGGQAGDVVGALAHLAPAQVAIAVAVKLQHVVQVAQGNVPTHGDVVAAFGGAQCQVAVAGLVCPGYALQKQDQHQEPAFHFAAPGAASCVASCAMPKSW